MTPTALDKTDYSILSILQENGRLTTKQIAERVNLSSTPVFERIKRLEREGYIRKYVAILDPEKLDLGFEAFCSVKLRQMSNLQGTAASRWLKLRNFTLNGSLRGSRTAWPLFVCSMWAT